MGQQFGLSFRIWLLAVAINTTGGIILLAGFGHEADIGLLLFFGTLFGLVVSVPALALMYWIINACVSRTWSGQGLFCAAMAGALGSGLLAWVLFVEFFGGSYSGEIQFLPLAIFSGVTATATQYKAFQRLAVYEEKVFETI